MSAILLHLAVLAVVGLWLIFRPFRTLRRVFTCWWLWIAMGLFVIGQLLGATGHVHMLAAILLCLPLLPSYRWRSDMRAAGLFQATLAILLTAVLSAVQDGPGDAGALSEAAGHSAGLMTAVVFVYSLMGIPVLARRLHLSIHRIRLRLVVSHLLVSIVPVGLAVPEPASPRGRWGATTTTSFRCPTPKSAWWWPMCPAREHRPPCSCPHSGPPCGVRI